MVPDTEEAYFEAEGWDGYNLVPASRTQTQPLKYGDRGPWVCGETRPELSLGSTPLQMTRR